MLGRVAKPPKTFAQFIGGQSRRKQTPEEIEAAIRSAFGIPMETPDE